MHYADKESLDWTRKTKTGGGYCILAYDEQYSQEDPDRLDHVESWVVSVDLIECIARFYTDKPEHGVQVLEENNNSDDNSDGDDI
jgi:hypothetical protein